MYFLNGGKACLTVIGDYLRDHGIERILLPAYLCPTIVTTLAGCGVRCDAYRVNEDLSIDLEDLGRKAGGYRAVYFINYFGFSPVAPVLAFLRELRQAGVIVVEDNAQAGFHEHPTGDFIFNSLRKFAPFDGGYLVTPHDVAPYLERYRDRPNRRLPLIRTYRKRLFRYYQGREDDFEALEALFAQAERYYDSDEVVLGDAQERAAIERLDWPGVNAARRENFRYLSRLIASIPEVRPIFRDLQADNMPCGLPVYFSGVARDRVNQELGQAQIGLTVHWEEILRHPWTKEQPLAVDMASKMLTLAIDQRMGRAQLDYLAAHLEKAIAKAKREDYEQG